MTDNFNTEMQLTPGQLAFIGLCNEYCSMAENASSLSRDELLAATLRMLPRLYIATTDLPDSDDMANFYIDQALDEDYYNSIRATFERILGEDDTYLEVFEEDMKYSDTPIAASIAEGLADIFQVCYNFIETVRDAPTPVIAEALGAIKDDFAGYWSRILCNLLRPLNQLRYNL